MILGKKNISWKPKHFLGLDRFHQEVLMNLKVEEDLDHCCAVIQALVHQMFKLIIEVLLLGTRPYHQQHPRLQPTPQIPCPQTVLKKKNLTSNETR